MCIAFETTCRQTVDQDQTKEQSDQGLNCLSFPLYVLDISLGLREDFGSIAKKGVGGGFLALKSHIICSTKKSCVKTKADIVCFSLNRLI